MSPYSLCARVCVCVYIHVLARSNSCKNVVLPGCGNCEVQLSCEVRCSTSLEPDKNLYACVWMRVHMRACVSTCMSQNTPHNNSTNYHRAQRDRHAHRPMRLKTYTEYVNSGWEVDIDTVPLIFQQLSDTCKFTIVTYHQFVSLQETLKTPEISVHGTLPHHTDWQTGTQTHGEMRLKTSPHRTHRDRHTDTQTHGEMRLKTSPHRTHRDRHTDTRTHGEMRLKTSSHCTHRHTDTRRDATELSCCHSPDTGETPCYHVFTVVVRELL